MVKVLIVDDSLVAQEFLAYILTSDPDIQIVGFANDGSETLEIVKEKKPDVITMDIHMNKTNGLDATREIMKNSPTPIVVVSASTSLQETSSLFQILEAGALAAVPRPSGIGSPKHAAEAQELIRTVKLMSEIKVVRRFSQISKRSIIPLNLPVQAAPKEILLIAIGASTGGPPVLNTIISHLPSNMPVPLLIVQHIAPGFITGFVEWLSTASNFPIHVATHGQQATPGHGYVAPDEFQMGIGSDLKIILSKHECENGFRPSVDFLFRSVEQSLGSRAAGVLLTGMGRDGAEGLRIMKNGGALTIAQEKSSSVVHGMPSEAIKLNAASYILPPEAIADMLVKLTRKTNGGTL